MNYNRSHKNEFKVGLLQKRRRAKSQKSQDSSPRLPTSVGEDLGSGLLPFMVDLLFQTPDAPEPHTRIPLNITYVNWQALTKVVLCGAPNSSGNQQPAFTQDQKPTGRIFASDSNTPMGQKISCIRTLWGLKRIADRKIGQVEVSLEKLDIFLIKYLWNWFSGID